MKKVFEGTEFTGVAAARKYLHGLGYSIGYMCGSDPMGFKKGNFVISKWHNLSHEDKMLMDGVIMGDMRYGPVTVFIYEDSDTKIIN